MWISLRVAIIAGFAMGLYSMIYTIGHSTREIDDFIRMLEAHGVNRLVDVRTVPRSRTNPQFNRDTLPVALAPHRIAYEHEASGWAG